MSTLVSAQNEEAGALRAGTGRLLSQQQEEPGCLVFLRRTPVSSRNHSRSVEISPKK